MIQPSFSAEFNGCYDEILLFILADAIVAAFFSRFKLTLLLGAIE